MPPPLHWQPGDRAWCEGEVVLLLAFIVYVDGRDQEHQGILARSEATRAVVIVERESLDLVPIEKMRCGKRVSSDTQEP